VDTGDSIWRAHDQYGATQARQDGSGQALRSRCAVYIDAGYLLAAAATRIAGTSLRSSVEADHGRLIDEIAGHAEEKSGLPLLRVHWYDAARDGVPDATQQKIGLLPRVKLRLGRIGFDGEQKGVDLRIGLDLVAHARNAAVEVIYLVSGDDDLTEAVEEAQSHGVQVIVLAVPTRSGDPHGVSRHLQSAADGLDLLAADALDTAVTPRVSVASAAGDEPVPEASPAPTPSPALLAKREQTPRSAPSASPGPSAALSLRPETGLVYSSSTTGRSILTSEYLDDDQVSEAIDRVVRRVLQTWLDGHTADQRRELVAHRPSIPRDVDRALLLDLSAAIDAYDLDDRVRHELRAQFWAAVDRNVGL
jgi:uncharacterized LabA/DUF88 family protein